MGAKRKFEAATAARIPEGEFTSTEDFNPNGFPQNSILWADQKLLDDLFIACTQVEETTEETAE